MSKLYTIEKGNPKGQPIIFVHGWASDHKSLLTTALPYFEKDYRCIFVDMLGYGKSEMYEKDESICIQNGREIGKLIKELDLKDVILYGNCVGGNTIFLGDFFNERVKAFVWIDGFLYFENKFLPFVTPIIRYPFYRFFFMSSLGLNLSNLFVKYAKKVPKQMVQNTRNIPIKVTLNYLKDLQNLDRIGAINTAKTFKCPSLFIIGDETMSVVKRSQKYWIENAKNSTADFVSNTRHLSVAENPEELNLKILKYLKSI